VRKLVRSERELYKSWKKKKLLLLVWRKSNTSKNWRR
jgi:hypothetical protein